MLSTDQLTLADGRRMQAKDLVNQRFSLLTLVDGEVQAVPAYAAWNAIEPVYALTTDSGRRIVRNADHPLWIADGVFGNGQRSKISSRGWTPLGEIVPGQLVAVTDVLPAFGNASSLTDDEVKILAYLIGDGGYTQTGVRFTQQSGAQLAEFTACVERLGCWLMKVPTQPYDYRIVARRGKPGQNAVINLLRVHGMMGHGSREKHIPEVIFSLPAAQQGLFLSRLYATDGWATVAANRTEIGYASASEQLARDVQELLVRFGIRSLLRHREDVDSWSVMVLAAEDVRRFIACIGIYGKEEAIGRVAAAVRTAYSRDRWRRKHAPPGTRWERVVAVESAGVAQTVAVEVPEYHTYLTTFWEHNTHLGGGLVNWWYDVHDPGLCITTAPTARQVKDLLWKEVRVQRRGRAGFPGSKSPRLESAADHFAHGFTAKDGDSFQGNHSPHTLFIFDEAVGVDSVFFETAESMFSGEGHAWLCIHNPTDTSSQVYAEELSGGWHVISLSVLDHPNVAAELAGLPPPFPSAIRLARVDTLLRKWCRPVNGKPLSTDVEWPPQSGQWLRPGPIAEARLLGRWPSQATNNVWSDGAFQAACALVLPEPDEPVQIGCDVARFGDDWTTIHVRRGGVSLHHESANGWDTSETAGRLKEIAREWGWHCGVDGRSVPVVIDDDGVGGGVTDQADGYNFIGLSGQAEAVEREDYPNRRSELWFTVAERAYEGRLSLARLSDEAKRELRRQAMAPTWKLDSDGRRVVEPKDKTKERIKRSPDDLDGMNLAYAVPPEKKAKAVKLGLWKR